MKRIILIVPINKRDAARAKLSELSGEDCTATLQAELNERGNKDTASHCVLNWACEDDVHDAIRDEFAKPSWRAVSAEGDHSLGKHKSRKKASTFIEERGLAKRRNKNR